MKTVTAICVSAKLHAKQVTSLGHAVLGAAHAARIGVADVGRSAATARGTASKHGIKQIDRLLSNAKIDDERAQAAFTRFVLGSRPVIVVTLDWTDYGHTGHHRIALSLVTRHGRATPLVWKTVTADELKGHRNELEDELLRRFKRALPKTVWQVIVLADRGFADVALYEMLTEELRFEFVVRFRRNIVVQDAAGEVRPGIAWVGKGGRAVRVAHALVTRQRHAVEAVIAVQRRGMKDAWLLATSLEWRAERIIRLYARRFTIEENFRDEKDDRFGWGTKELNMDRSERRDRLHLILAMAMVILTLLGAAGEALGLDRQLRANTVRRRTHSLFRQGREYLRGAIGKLSDGRRRLRNAFLAALRALPKQFMPLGQI